MKNRNILISVIAVLAIASTVYGLVPPPPANQFIGVYDSSVIYMVEQDCRNCHTSGVPDRHHYLVANGTINPTTGTTFGCMDCHPVVTGPSGQSVLMDRNCMDCHKGAAFYANPTGVNIPRPHHNTTQAQTRDCKFCHGAFVDNYNDGHYIPAYNTSNFTPDPSYKVINSTSGRKWGGCEACHEENGYIIPQVYANSKTHHNAFWYIADWTNSCNWCHIVDGSGHVTENIRKCEDCHSVSTIHNIQYNYNATNGQLGWGHIGNDWDCNGCHASYVAGDIESFIGAIIPDIASVNPNKLVANTPTTVTITGSDFLSGRGTYKSVVVIDGNTTLTPASLTESRIVVNIPALSAGVHTIKVVKTGDASGDKSSKLSALTVVTTVNILSAKLAQGKITITGTGFGTDAQQMVTITKAGAILPSDSITSWSDTQIVATSLAAAVGDTVTVTTPTGAATATIEAGATPTPTPTPTPTSITVSSPNGGENWKRGTTHAITWTSVSNPGANVKIELLKGTSVVSTIANGVSNSGSYSWKIPSGQSPANNYRIRITSTSNSAYTDTSDSYFTISK